ncbi:MAG: HipA domain-containing protein [Lachnospiraceae bacterium]
MNDHLRNHTFILTKTGWILSPLYDVNPVPFGDELSLNVDEEDNRISLELAIKTAPRFGISKMKAKEYADVIMEIVATNWGDLAKKYGLSRAQIEEMRPAFSFCVK